MMKKVLFVAILSMASLFLSAQHVEFGLKTGLNIANLKDKNGNPNDYYHTKLGVYGGVFTHVHITNRWAVQPEIVFSLTGHKIWQWFITGNRQNFELFKLTGIGSIYDNIWFSITGWSADRFFVECQG